MINDCGPVSLQFALHRDGQKAKLIELAEQLKTRKDNGAWTLSMARVMEDRGYKTWIETDVTWERVKDLLEKRCWLFISWWTFFFPEGETRSWGGTHWSVITKVTEDKVWLYDPSYKAIVAYPRATIDANWLSPEKAGRVVHDEVRVMVVSERPTRPPSAIEPGKGVVEPRANGKKAPQRPARTRKKAK